MLRRRRREAAALTKALLTGPSRVGKRPENYNFGGRPCGDGGRVDRGAAGRPVRVAARGGRVGPGQVAVGVALAVGVRVVAVAGLERRVAVAPVRLEVEAVVQVGAGAAREHRFAGALDANPSGPRGRRARVVDVEGREDLVLALADMSGQPMGPGAEPVDAAPTAARATSAPAARQPASMSSSWTLRGGPATRADARRASYSPTSCPRGAPRAFWAG